MDGSKDFGKIVAIISRTELESYLMLTDDEPCSCYEPRRTKSVKTS